MLPLPASLQGVALSYIPFDGGDIRKLNPGYDYGNFRHGMPRMAIEESAIERLKSINVYNYNAYKLKHADIDADQYLRDHKFSIIYADTDFAKKNPDMTAEDYLLQHKFTAFDTYSDYKKRHPHINAERYLIEYDFEKRIADCPLNEKRAILHLAEESVLLNFKKVALEISYVAEEVIETLLPACFICSVISIVSLVFLGYVCATCFTVLKIEHSVTFINIRRIFDKNIEALITAIGGHLINHFNYKYVIDIASLSYLIFQSAIIFLQIQLQMGPYEGRDRRYYYEKINERINILRLGAYASALVTQKQILSLAISIDVYFSILNPPQWMKNLEKMLGDAVNFPEKKIIFHNYMVNMQEELLEIVRNYQEQNRYELAKDLWVERVLETH